MAHDRSRYAAAADRVLWRISVKLQRLETYPELGARRPDIADTARMLVVGNYLILYEADDHAVEIVRIIHAARDLSGLLEG